MAARDLLIDRLEDRAPLTDDVPASPFRIVKAG
jgi:hypothetical protein